VFPLACVDGTVSPELTGRIERAKHRRRAVKERFFHTAGLVRGRKYIRGSGPNGERGLIPEIGLETPGNPAWDQKCMIVDGSRKRRHSSNPVKRQWYARHRAIRFSRRFLAAAVA
jgi:hypothetical protein